MYVTTYPLGSGIHPRRRGPGRHRPCTVPHRRSRSSRSARPAEPSPPSERGAAELRHHDGPRHAGVPRHPGLHAEEPRCVLRGRHPDLEHRNLANPSASDGEPHTHIRSPSAADQFEFMHSAFISWDGKKFGTMDETGGGVTAECDGDAREDGFYYFYKMVTPGSRSFARGTIQDPAGGDARGLGRDRRRRRAAVTGRDELLPVRQRVDDTVDLDTSGDRLRIALDHGPRTRGPRTATTAAVANGG